MVDGHGGIEQVGLARARAPAAHVDGGDRRLVEHDRRGARRKARVVGMANRKPGDIGDEIARHDTSFGNNRLANAAPRRCVRTLNINRMCLLAD
jgi:hypothetical protein